MSSPASVVSKFAMLKSEVSISKPNYDCYFSVFSISEKTKGVFIKGAEYPLNNETLFIEGVLIYDENKEAVIVDPADKAEIIITEIEKLELKPKYVLLTHGHVDHVLALEEIVKKYNIKVIANIHEKDMLVGNVSNCSNVFGLTQNYIY